MKNVIKGFFGIVLIGIAITAMIYWETYGREKMLYEEIVVLVEDVTVNEVITEDKISYEKRDDSSLVKDVIKDASLILGKAAKHYIPAGAQLVEQYFEEDKLVLDQHEYITHIPMEWIQSFPNTLRRGDVIYFYEVLGNKSNREIKQALSTKEPIAKSTVAFVKDSSNREVITLSDKERYDGSSKISEIEIISNIETINLIRRKFDEGMKFIILYK